MRFKFARLQIRMRHVAEFLLLESYFYFFSFRLIELLFGRVLASICEAQLLKFAIWASLRQFTLSLSE